MSLLALAVVLTASTGSRAGQVPDVTLNTGAPDASGKVSVTANLTSNGNAVGGTQNTILFDNTVLSMSTGPGGSALGCKINAAIGLAPNGLDCSADATVGPCKNLLAGVHQCGTSPEPIGCPAGAGSSTSAINLVLAATAVPNVNAIPDGVLYTCTFTLANAAAWPTTLSNVRLVASDPLGAQLCSFTGVPCGGATEPTPSPTSTALATPSSTATLSAPTPTVAPPATPSSTATLSAPTPTVTPPATPSSTATSSAPTPTAAPPATPSSTATSPPTPTVVPSETPSATATPSASTPTAAPAATSSATATSSAPIPTATPSAPPSSTATSSASTPTVAPAATSSPTSTSASPGPLPTNTREVLPTDTAGPPAATDTPLPTTASETPTLPPKATNTPTALATETATAAATLTATGTATATATSVPATSTATAGTQAHLAAAIGASDTTIPVDDTSGFPGSGTVRVDGELITYTGKTLTALTGVTRGVDGTMPAAHQQGVTVVLAAAPSTGGGGGGGCQMDGGSGGSGWLLLGIAVLLVLRVRRVRGPGIRAFPADTLCGTQAEETR